MKNLIYALFFLACLVSTAYGQKDAEVLNLTIKSNKSVYKTGEPVFFEYVITNTGNQLIIIDPPFSDEGIIDLAAYSGTFFIQRQEDNNSIEVFPLADIDWERSRSVEIAPHASYAKKINIIGMIEKKGEGEVQYSSNLFLYKGGHYKIIGKFIPRLIRPNCWKKVLESNAVFVKVEEKKHITQDEAYRIAKKACLESAWPWVDVKILDQEEEFLVVTNASHRDGHAEIYIDKKTGNVLRKFRKG